MPFLAARSVGPTLVIASLVVAAPGLVHAPIGTSANRAVTHLDSAGAARAQTRSGASRPAPARAQPTKPPEVIADPARLPAPVTEMREAILAAVASGRIEDLRTAFDWNELKPDIAPGPVADPIAHWRAVSGDGEGREILAALAEILAQPCAVLPLGPDLENNRIFVWPALAELPLSALTPPQEVDLLRLVSPDAARAMKAAGRYTHWRITIGADGTWHAFGKIE